MPNYLQRLAEITAERGRLCVGLDPHPPLLEAWGLSVDVNGAERLARETIAATGDLVAVYKPQAAFFECFGAAGYAALERVLADIKAAGALSILDVKRGDIGSTMSAYARAFFGPDAPLAADAITLSPFLGFESLRPALDLANANESGVYVLCRTSNPQGGEVQLAQSWQRSVAQRIVDAAVAEAEQAGSAYVGLVIGATLAELDVDLSHFDGSILAPGVGAQGGTIGGLTRLFGESSWQVLASVSRQVLAAGPDPEALRSAVSEIS